MIMSHKNKFRIAVLAVVIIALLSVTIAVTKRNNKKVSTIEDYKKWHIAFMKSDSMVYEDFKKTEDYQLFLKTQSYDSVRYLYGQFMKLVNYEDTVGNHGIPRSNSMSLEEKKKIKPVFENEEK